MQVHPTQVQWMRAVRLAAILFPVVLVACSATNSTTGSNPITNPPPVNAQTTYSNAALSGTYSISYVASPGNSGGLENTGVGTATLDGNGNISAISLETYWTDGGFTCQYTGSGTYTVSANASGTAKIFLTSSTTRPSGSQTCTLPALEFATQAAQQGASFFLNENDGNGATLISALKQ